MKYGKKILAIVFLSILVVLLICTGVFVFIYASRFKTMSSIEEITNYSDGYNLYHMNVDYDYNLEHVINDEIIDNQDFIDAIVKESIPILPIHMKAPDFGCSAFALTEPEGDVLMGRNYDFRYNTSAMLVHCNPSDGYSSVAFSALDNLNVVDPDAGITSKMACLLAPFTCLDGMNEKGVSIAVLTLDCEPTYQETDKPTLCTTLAIRLVLDKAASTAEAVELLKQYDMFATSGRDYHFYISDASGDSRVIEYDCHSEQRELVDIPTRTVTNFFILYKDKVTTNGKNGIYGHGLDRYQKIEEVLSTADQLDKSIAWDALKKASQEPVEGSVTSNTQWSIVFNNTDQTLEFVLHKNWDDVICYDLNTNTVDAP